MSEIGDTTVGAVRKILQDFEDDMPIGFEYIVASLFPDAYSNMQSLLKDAHTQGYIQAMEELNGNKQSDNTNL